MNYKSSTFFILILCIISCTDSTDKNIPPTNKTETTINAKPVVDLFSYDNYKKLFGKVELPFYFDTDSIHKDNSYKKNTELYDSLGHPKSETVIKKEFVLRWMLDKKNVKPNNDFSVSFKDENINRYYNDPYYWATITPYIKIENEKEDVLFVLIYNQTSEVNGGYTQVWALIYDKKGKLIRAKQIGTFGEYITTDMKMQDKDDYWKRTTDYDGLQVLINSAKQVLITTIETREIIANRYAPVKKDSLSKKVRSKKQKTISLE